MNGMRREEGSSLSYEKNAGAAPDLATHRFNHLADRGLGFIAEDALELLTIQGPEGLTSQEAVSVITKVVQQQEKRIAQLEALLNVRR